MIVLAKVIILKSSNNSVTHMIDIPTCLIVASFEAIASCIVVSVNPSDISTNFSKDIVVCSNPVSFGDGTQKTYTVGGILDGDLYSNTAIYGGCFLMPSELRA